MKKIFFIALFVLISIFAAAANFASAAAPESRVYDEEEGVVILAEATGNFFGDGRDVKVEMVGHPFSLFKFTAEKQEDVCEIDDSGNFVCGIYDDTYIYMDSDGKIEDGALIEYIAYHLRFTIRDTGETQCGFTIDGMFASRYYDFKLCDIDGDGVSEIYFRYNTGTSAVIDNVVIASLKDGKYRELLNVEGRFDEEEYIRAPFPYIEGEPKPDFLIEFTAGVGERNASLLLDFKNNFRGKEYYEGWFFTTDGDLIEGANYEPDIDYGFRHSGVADIDGDGRDEVYGAIPVNGTSNADDIVYINVAYKWMDDGWNVCFISITDIDSPLADMPGVDAGSSSVCRFIPGNIKHRTWAM